MLIGGRHVRVRAEDGGDAALEIVTDQVLVGGGLGVHVDHDALGLAGQALQNALGSLIRAFDRPHVCSAQQTERRHGRAVLRRRQRVITARRSSREVGRTADALILFEYGNNVSLLVDMIAERHQVDTRLAQPSVVLRAQAGAVGRVLGVGDDEIDVLARHQHRQGFLDKGHAGFADNIAEEEDTHQNSP